MDLQTYLKKHDISQAEFGKQLGVSQGLVWQWLNGETTVTIDRAKQIVSETGGQVTAHDLMPEIFPQGFTFPPPLGKSAEGSAATKSGEKTGEAA